MDAAAVSAQILNDVSNGQFAPVYLLMGEEPYYVDVTAEKIIADALTEDERDFNQFIMYGMDVTVDDVVGNARRYPMFAERNLVVVREAQLLKGIDNLSVYTENPLESTVLVIVYRGNVDKRKAFYKSVQKNGVVLESTPVRDYELPNWIQSYYRGRGLNIDPDAASLLAESIGTDLGKIALETDKMMKNLPEGTSRVSVKDIENNVGISREFSIFELTKQLSYKDARKALRTATYIGSAAKFAMPMATAALFTHFNRILRYEALLMKNPRPDTAEKTKILSVNPFFFKEYDEAVRNYPLPRCMRAVELIKEYDFKGKGGDAGEASPQEMFIELITKLLYL